MAQPKIAARTPVAVELKAGKEYYWCACGRSKNQPFCDGSHEGTEFKPLAFTPEENGEAHLCRCKRTGNPPYCDGSHAGLDDEDDADTRQESGANDDAPVKSTREEPTLERIHELARHGLDRTGPHGETVAMGVPRAELPRWDDIQILTAQLATRPLAEDAEVGTELVIGPRAKRPLRLEIPLFVSDMSFGSLSREAKLALAKGSRKAGQDAISPPAFPDLVTPGDFRRFADRVREVSGGWMWTRGPRGLRDSWKAPWGSCR